MKTTEIQETLVKIIEVHLQKARLAPGSIALNHLTAAEKAIEMLSKLEPQITHSVQ